MEKTYVAIDLKSFYASVECVERQLDPLNTNLVVADESRTEKTICLAVSPSLKSFGISGRARLFEVIQRVEQVNKERLQKAPKRQFAKKSYIYSELSDPACELDYIVATPQMAKYLAVSAKIYGIYLKYVSPEDIFAYSGLGCRNVSLLFLPRGYMPELRCTALNEKYRRNYLRERALLRMCRMPFVDLDGAVLCEDRSFPAALSRIHYTFYDSLADVEAWLAAHDDRLQCVVSQCVRHSRRVAFGRAQHPGLTDYADDVDTMRFLGTI